MIQAKAKNPSVNQLVNRAIARCEFSGNPILARVVRGDRQTLQVAAQTNDPATIKAAADELIQTAALYGVDLRAT